ncbi:hypothetical protein C8R42DRAFT_216548 [Lentinula raphanica]|nr:hypothetical protein C8R42DRAFT_216548 [Lentinula raphanica]
MFEGCSRTRQSKCTVRRAARGAKIILVLVFWPGLHPITYCTSRQRTALPFPLHDASIEGCPYLFIRPLIHKGKASNPLAFREETIGVRRLLEKTSSSLCNT